VIAPARRTNSGTGQTQGQGQTQAPAQAQAQGQAPAQAQTPAQSQTPAQAQTPAQHRHRKSDSSRLPDASPDKIDVAGVRLGMSPDEVRAILKFQESCRTTMESTEALGHSTRPRAPAADGQRALCEHHCTWLRRRLLLSGAPARTANRTRSCSHPSRAGGRWQLSTRWGTHPQIAVLETALEHLQNRLCAG